MFTVIFKLTKQTNILTMIINRYGHHAVQSVCFVYKLINIFYNKNNNMMMNLMLDPMVLFPDNDCK